VGGNMGVVAAATSVSNNGYGLTQAIQLSGFSGGVLGSSGSGAFASSSAAGVLAGSPYCAGSGPGGWSYMGGYVHVTGPGLDQSDGFSGDCGMYSSLAGTYDIVVGYYAYLVASSPRASTITVSTSQVSVSADSTVVLLAGTLSQSASAVVVALHRSAGVPDTTNTGDYYACFNSAYSAGSFLVTATFPTKPAVSGGGYDIPASATMYAFGSDGTYINTFSPVSASVTHVSHVGLGPTPIDYLGASAVVSWSLLGYLLSMLWLVASILAMMIGLGAFISYLDRGGR
jgi:hypothetical protein